MRTTKARGNGAVHIGVHEMRVHDVRFQHAREAQQQQRVEVAGRRDARRGNPQCAVEVISAPRRVVQPDEARLDTALHERRQQGEQVALGAPDAADPMDVDDLHSLTGPRRLAAAAPFPGPREPPHEAVVASSTVRKSHGTR